MFLAIASRPLPLIKFLKLTTNAGNWFCIEQPANCWHEMYKYHYVAKQVRNRVNVMPAIGCITRYNLQNILSRFDYIYHFVLTIKLLEERNLKLTQASIK